MDRWIRDVPIGRKLSFITLLSSTLALLLACASFVAYDRFYFRATLASDLAITARIIGDNSAAALAFGDQDSAEQTLKSLAAEPHIVGAAAYDRDGQLFGVYRATTGGSAEFVAPPVEPDGVRFGRNRLEVFHAIDLAGEHAGTIYIRSSLEGMRERLWRYGLITFGVMLVAAVLAYLLATRLQRAIVEPISRLTQVVGLLARSRDYSVRVPKTSDDELGRLIAGFNEMLDQIQLRDAALEDAREGLERRVAERTSELQLEIAERRHAELALRSSEERSSSAFEHAAIGMALVAPGGAWLKVNRALCQLLGYPAERLLARSVQDLTHPDDQATELAQRRRVLLDELASYQLEQRYLHHDGSVVWVLLGMSLVRDPAGQPLHFIAQIQDITQRKYAEAELERTHKQLLEASRRGGMAEVATHVLHNVGNVLNSVNVSASLVSENVRQSRAASLAQLVELLRDHDADLGAWLQHDPRGRHVPAFLEQVSTEWLGQQQAVLKELDLLRANIDHIKRIVALQQDHAKADGAIEQVQLADLLEDALQMDAEALARQQVEIVRDYAELPPIQVDRHKLLQILVNLIRNARQACEALPLPGRLLVRVEALDGRVQATIADNGAGIAAEHLTRIFAHGFTTRKDGHGFGLNSGALAAAELGGSLRAHSAGLGLGASFVLQLPLAPPLRDPQLASVAADEPPWPRSRPPLAAGRTP